MIGFKTSIQNNWNNSEKHPSWVFYVGSTPLTEADQSFTKWPKQTKVLQSFTKFYKVLQS